MERNEYEAIGSMTEAPVISFIEIPDRDYWMAVEQEIADDRVRARYPDRLARELSRGIWRNYKPNWRTS